VSFDGTIASKGELFKHFLAEVDGVRIDKNKEGGKGDDGEHHGSSASSSAAPMNAVRRRRARRRQMVQLQRQRQKQQQDGKERGELEGERADHLHHQAADEQPVPAQCQEEPSASARAPPLPLPVPLPLPTAASAKKIAPGWIRASWIPPPSRYTNNALALTNTYIYSWAAGIQKLSRRAETRKLRAQERGEKGSEGEGELEGDDT
jgi:hypothetical protein